MEKVFMRFNSVPASELENAVKWFSDTYLEESRVKPSNPPTLIAEDKDAAIRTAPDRIGIKWWWTDDEMLVKLKGFAEVFYYNDLGDW